MLCIQQLFESIDFQVKGSAALVYGIKERTLLRSTGPGQKFFLITHHIIDYTKDGGHETRNPIDFHCYLLLPPFSGPGILNLQPELTGDPLRRSISVTAIDEMFDVLQGSVQGDLASGGDGIPRVPSRDRQAFFDLFFQLIAGSLHE